MGRVPNQVNRSLPIWVQKPFATLWRAPVSVRRTPSGTSARFANRSTDIQGDVCNPARIAIMSSEGDKQPVPEKSVTAMLVSACICFPHRRAITCEWGPKRPGNQPHWRQPKRPAEPPDGRPTIATLCATRVETTIISESRLRAFCDWGVAVGATAS